MSTEIAFIEEVEEVFEIEEVKEEFKPVISVTELWMKTLENVTKDFGARVTQALADKYGFASEEAVAFLGLESVAVNRKAMAKRSKSSKEPKEKKEKKEKKAKEEKVRLPFTGACDATKCQGVSYNHGLFTQCMKSPLENHTYCKNCQAQADKNASGKPDCGTMTERLASPMYGYTDSKNRSPVPYAKIMAKYGYTREQVEAEFAKLNGDAVLNPVFFEEPAKKSAGRHKKTTEAVATTDDLFNSLTAENGAEMGAETATTTSKKGAKLTEEEKNAKKLILDAARIAKNAEKAAKDKEEKEKKAAERAVKLAEAKVIREAKKEQEKLQKAQQKAEDKLKKADEKKKKEDEAKATKEAEKLKKEAEKKAKNEASPVISPVIAKTTETKTTTETKEAPKTETKEEEPKKKQVAVKKVMFDGVKHFYNPETLVVYNAGFEIVGTYDKENNKLVPLPTEKNKEDDEVKSETYDSDEDRYD